METLKLEHLKGYLGCGLKIQADDKIACLTGIESETPSTQERVIYKTHEKEFRKTYFYQVKPILFPLSSLTKEIEINGEKFVPLQKICRMIAYNEQYPKNWNYYTEVQNVSNGTQFGTFEKELVYCTTATDSIVSREFGYYSKSKRFYLKNNRDKQDLTYAVNQFLGLKKLQEWKFDIHGLIEKGLAIAVTDDFNPYKTEK